MSSSEPAFVNPIWLAPVSVDPDHFVNRDADVQKLRRYLDNHLQYKTRNGHILVTGDRGVGKSIFCRHVARAFATSNPNDVLLVSVDARGIGQREFLQTFATLLVGEARAGMARRDHEVVRLEEWLRTLSELATNDRVVRREAATTGREYGAGTEAGGTLFGVLTAKGSVSWKEKREQGQVQELWLDVTDSVLRSACKEMLSRLADERWMVVVLFDDLDQARDVENADAGKNAVRSLMDLCPCIQVVHLRDEAVHRDIRREHNEWVPLEPLQVDGLEKILRKRLVSALAPEKAAFATVAGWAPLRALATVTGNPYVLLRWAHALQDQHTWPPPDEWKSPEGLLRIARQAATAPGVSDELLRRLAGVVDRCGRLGGSPHFQRADLQRGCRDVDTSPAPSLTADEVALLERVELLLPVDRYEPTGPLRMDPTLELLLPSVGERLRQA